MNQADFESQFSYHPPRTEQRRADHEDVREGCLLLAAALNVLVPDGREKDIAIERLREVMMWANAGIACRPDDG